MLPSSQILSERKRLLLRATAPHFHTRKTALPSGESGALAKGQPHLLLENVELPLHFNGSLRKLIVSGPGTLRGRVRIQHERLFQARMSGKKLEEKTTRSPE